MAPELRLSGYDPLRSANPATTDRSTTFAYQQRPCIHGGHTALSSDWREILVEESSVVIAKLDVLCRAAQVICGLETRSACEAAALLGIDPAGVQGAYCAAIKSLEIIKCQQFQRRNDSAAVYN